MPLCYCYTNLPESAIPAGFEERFTQCISEVLPNKPIEKIAVLVVPVPRMCKGGSTDPSMIVQLRSIGVFDKDRNPDYFPKFFKFLTTELKLPENRFAIELVDIQATYVQNGK